MITKEVVDTLDENEAALDSFGPKDGSDRSDRVVVDGLTVRNEEWTHRSSP